MTKPQPPFLQAFNIVRQVANAHGIHTRDILGPGRCPWYVAARREAAFRISTEVLIGNKPASSTFVGRALGRDHSTILALMGKTSRAKRAAARRQVAAL